MMTCVTEELNSVSPYCGPFPLVHFKHINITRSCPKEVELGEEKSCQEHLGYKGMNKRHGGYILTEHQYSGLYSK